MLHDLCCWLAGGELGAPILEEMMPLFLLLIGANAIHILNFVQYYFWTKTLENVINILYLMDFGGILLFFFLKITGLI